MINFTYYTPTEVVFGKGTEEKTAELVKKYGGTNVLIHYGGKSAQKLGLLDKLQSNLIIKDLNIHFWVELFQIRDCRW